MVFANLAKAVKNLSIGQGLTKVFRLHVLGSRRRGERGIGSVMKWHQSTTLVRSEDRRMGWQIRPAIVPMHHVLVGIGIFDLAPATGLFVGKVPPDQVDH